MSYARFSEGDIYLYVDSLFMTWKCYCDIPGPLTTLREVQDHLDKHVARGDKVPDRTLTRIKEEIEEFGKDGTPYDIYDKPKPEQLDEVAKAEVVQWLQDMNLIDTPDFD